MGLPKHPKISRTINALHFEDLESHRFEDLIRQLAYDFRPWLFLEATGRLGQDGGVDIRGLERVENVIQDLSEEYDEDSPDQPASAQHKWRIQCKRYRTIGPKLIRQIVEETVPDPSKPPYGLIIAAACDVSAKTIRFAL